MEQEKKDETTEESEERKDKLEVGFQIKALRNKNNVTQADFYNETDINIARAESGKNDICLKTLRKIVKVFHTSLSSFFDTVEKKDKIH